MNEEKTTSGIKVNRGLVIRPIAPRGTVTEVEIKEIQEREMEKTVDNAPLNSTQ